MFELTPFVRTSMRSYNPFKELEDMERQFFGSSPKTLFRTDIHDNGDSYVLEADLPGMNKQDINLSIEGDYLTITAERKAQVNKEDDNRRIIYSERSFGSYTRGFDISGIDQTGISAEYTDGVLKVTMPKRAETKPQVRKLEIK